MKTDSVTVKYKLTDKKVQITGKMSVRQFHYVETITLLFLVINFQ